MPDRSAVLVELKEHVDRQVFGWEQLRPCSPADFEEKAAWKRAQQLVNELLEE